LHPQKRGPVPCHRRLLLDERRSTGRWSRAARYARRGALVGVFSLSPVIVLVMAEIAGMPKALETWAGVAGLLRAYRGTRVITLLPAVAVDRQQSVRDAWRITRGSGIRLWLGAIFAVLPFSLLSKVLARGLGAGGVAGLLPSLAVEAVFVAIFFVQLAIAMAYASSIFRQGSAWQMSGTACGRGAGEGPLGSAGA
jgi:hypothetical protein